MTIQPDRCFGAATPEQRPRKRPVVIGVNWYVVLGGNGQIKLDDRFLEVRPLDAIRVAPKVVRAFEAGPEGLEFLAVGPHHRSDGEPVDDPWIE